MRKLVLAAASIVAVAGLAACGESAADKAAEQQADALEAQAAATPNEAQEQALNAEADRIEQQAGNADGGMTTSNTPDTSPSTPAPAPAN
jgi:ABC-type glycerol-3-phosphate transport system substrate-binding protein